MLRGVDRNKVLINVGLRVKATQSDRDTVLPRMLFGLISIDVDVSVLQIAISDRFQYNSI